ncbi:MAG: glycosyltransferase family 4 protein [candidate division WOR-3 bacterium]|nr:MAG: glycosyltransferase family 4 protein [candidate division WOR-3 bacterium]
MVKRGCRVCVLAPTYTAGTRKRVVELGAEPVEFQMKRIGINPAEDSLVVIRLAILLRKLGVDTCLSFMTKLVIYGSIAAFFAGVPYRYSMIEGLGYYFTQEEQKDGVRKVLIRTAILLLYRLSLPLNRAVFFLNPDDPAELATRGLLRRTSALVLPGGIGVNTQEYEAAPLFNDPFTFLLVGRLLRAKGFREYVTAAARIRQEYPHIRFVLMGDQDANPGSVRETEVRSWVEAGMVEWLREAADIKPWFRATTVCVLPSYREGMPCSVLQAMAMGRAIVTTDAPGCRETIQRLGSGEALGSKKGRFATSGRVIPGRNGFLIPVRDVDALVEAMEYFIINPELITRMGGESRRLAEERFDVRKTNARILKEMGL